MNELQQIRIKIAEKEYSLKIRASEEALLRKAAKELNEKLKTMQKKTGIWDKQDLLAMTAFDCLVQNLKNDQENTSHIEQLKKMWNMIDEVSE